jgi:glucosamine-6-phosphate deaminase
MSAPIRILASPDAVGAHLAERLLAQIAEARESGAHFLLGCPTGRTPRPIFGAMATRLAERPQDLSHVVLVMMDEYLVQGPDGLEHAPSSMPWSCHWFGEREIAARLNEPLAPEQRIRERSIWFPDPRDPEDYERRIDGAGGIDLFLLASGASDGHVAFNQPGSPRDSRTRIIPLSEQTRRDNLATFPTFGALDAVPHHGVSVGIDTIARSKSAVMVVLGAGKRETFARMSSADRYTPDWPATVIHECRGGEIVADEDASR